MATLKDKINRILGNNVRLLLPSYWWKRAFGLVIDKIEEVENAASGNGITIVSSEEELNTLDLPNGSVASVNGVKKMKFSECYQLSSADNDLEIEDLVKKLTIVKEIGVNFPLPTFTTEYDATYRIYNLNENQISGSVFILIDGVDYRVTYTTETDREEFLIKSQSDIDRINDILGSGDFYYIGLENNGLGSENVKIIDTAFYVVSDSISATAYIKGDSWERLAKESDINITFDSELSKTSKNAVQNKVIAEEFDKQQCVFVVSSDGTSPENYKQQNIESYNKVCESIDANRWMNVFVLYSAYFRIQVDSITISGSNELVLYATFDNSFIEFRVSSDGSVATQNSGSLKIDSRVSDEIEGKEDKANKTTTLSSASTDTQYPSAKAVYDALQNMEEYVKTYVDNAIKNLNNQ